MDTQVWIELAQQFKKILSFYNGSSGESNIDVLRPHLKKAGKSYFQLLQENEHIEITTPPEFLVKPVLKNETDNLERTHRFIDAYDRYWICVLGLLGRCGYIVVENKKLREMKIPMLYTRQRAEANWSAYFLHGLGPREGFLLNEKDYVIAVCEASIKACQFLISKLSDKSQLTRQQIEAEQKTVPDDESKEEILPENRTKPMSIKEMAGYWDIHPRKLANYIKKGVVKTIKLGREDYIFDITILPQQTIAALKKDGKI